MRQQHHLASAGCARKRTNVAGVTHPEVSIIIPTFRRPEDLRNVLRSCLSQRSGSYPLEVIVVDNAPERSAAPILATIDAGTTPIRYIHEPRRGISHARNAGFAHARGRLLALIDDDEQASPDWLEHLTEAQRKYGADVVFGPVYPEFEQPPERYLGFLRRFYTYALRRPTGSGAGVRSTNNALVRRECVRTKRPFRAELGLTGGEDTLFLHQLLVEGARFVWCAEAFVTERIPPERTRWDYIWKRAFQRGQCRAATPMHLDPPRKAETAFWMAVGAVQFLGLLPVVTGLWLLDRQRALYCAWKMIGGLGKVFWMTRFRRRIYGEPLSRTMSHPQRRARESMLSFVRTNAGLFRRWNSLQTALLVCWHALRTRITGSDFKRTNPPLIVHAGHHKVMTSYFANVFQLLAFALDLKYQSCAQEELEADTDIFFQTHSRIHFSRLPPYRGTHIVRDPRDVVVSGYFYHKWTAEHWCAVDRAYDGMSYRDRLNSLSKEDGLIFEIDHAGHETLSDMIQWNYDNPNILELKYEKLITENNEALCRQIFHHYGFEGRELELCVALMRLFSFSNRTGRKVGRVAERSHLRSGAAGGWREHLSEAHKARLEEQFGPLFIKIGYETGNDW